MISIKNQVKNDDGELILHIHIRSACCKCDLFFIEDKPNHFIYADTRLEVDKGMAETIINLRRMEK